MDAENTFVLNLIENVKNQKCLYDKNDGFYYNRSVKERTWQEVSEKCNKSAAECKHRWKLLRERFVKEMKKPENPSNCGIWKYFDALMFVKDSTVPRGPRSNIDDQEDVELALDHSVLSAASLEDATTPTAPVKKKQKVSLDSICQKFEASIDKLENSYSTSTTEANPLDDAFLNIVSCLMKELAEPVKEEFQACMLQELYRLRRENKYH